MVTLMTVDASTQAMFETRSLRNTGDARSVRVAALAGLAFGGLVITASQVQGSRPSLDDSSRDVLTYITDHQDGLQASAALFAVGMALVLFWAWGLFNLLRNAEGGATGLATVAVAGGVLAAAMTIVSSAVLATTAMRINELRPADARFYFTLYQLTQVGATLGLAVLIGAAAIVSLRRGVFAPWFRVASVVVALISLFGGLGVAYGSDAPQVVCGIALVLDTVWIMSVSVRLWRTPEIAIS